MSVGKRTISETYVGLAQLVCRGGKTAGNYRYTGQPTFSSTSQSNELPFLLVLPAVHSCLHDTKSNHNKKTIKTSYTTAKPLVPTVWRRWSSFFLGGRGGGGASRNNRTQYSMSIRRSIVGMEPVAVSFFGRYVRTYVRTTVLAIVGLSCSERVNTVRYGTVKDNLWAWCVVTEFTK